MRNFSENRQTQTIIVIKAQKATLKGLFAYQHGVIQYDCLG